MYIHSLSSNQSSPPYLEKHYTSVFTTHNMLTTYTIHKQISYYIRKCLADRFTNLPEMNERQLNISQTVSQTQL